jgi:hypothetical protein
MKRFLAALMVAAATFSISACDDYDDTYVQEESVAVCVNPDTGERVDDSQCGRHDYYHNSASDAFAWYFIATTLAQPRVGQQVVHNTYYSSPKMNPYAGYKAPQTAQIAKGVPKTGWTPSANTKSYLPKDKSNITAPKVIQQAPKPMYNQKPVYNPPKPVYKAPAPVYRPAPAPRR